MIARRICAPIMLALAIACRPSEPAENAWSIRSMSTAPGGVLVMVMLDERHIAAPDTPIDSGMIAFSITNGGAESHALMAEPPGAGIDAGPPFRAGHTRRVDVTLAPGRYVLYCPLAGHRQRGESTTITVAATGSSR